MEVCIVSGHILMCIMMKEGFGLGLDSEGGLYLWEEVVIIASGFSHECRWVCHVMDMLQTDIQAYIHSSLLIHKDQVSLYLPIQTVHSSLHNNHKTKTHLTVIHEIC